MHLGQGLQPGSGLGREPFVGEPAQLGDEPGGIRILNDRFQHGQHGFGHRPRPGGGQPGQQPQQVRVVLRVEKAGILHAGVGKVSFSEEALLENIRAFADAVNRSKPTGAKGTYVKRVAVSSTMGPGVHVDPSSVNASA